MIKRRRNELDRILDRLVAGEDPVATGDLASFLHPARVARAALVRHVPPAVAHGHLARLRSDRSENIVVAPNLRRRGFRPAAVVLVAALTLVLSAGSMVAASAEALPGDALYGVKRAVERVSLAMHRDPLGRVSLRLQFAETRLAEIEALIAAGRDPSDVLDDLDAELASAEGEALNAIALGRDAEALFEHVQSMISKHIEVLNTVLGKAPQQAQDAIERAISNAEKAQENVQRGRQQANNQQGGKPSSPGKSGSAPGRN